MSFIYICMLICEWYYICSFLSILLVNMYIFYVLLFYADVSLTLHYIREKYSRTDKVSIIEAYRCQPQKQAVSLEELLGNSLRKNLQKPFLFEILLRPGQARPTSLSPIFYNFNFGGKSYHSF